MVGRYNELVFMGIIMVYKPTYNWGAPSCNLGICYIAIEHGDLYWIYPLIAW